MGANRFVASILIGSVTLFGLFESGSTCKCAQLSLEQKYCQSDFVLKVDVRSNLTNPNGQPDFDDYYKITLIEKWKFNFANKVAIKDRLYTGTDSVMCGVTLQQGTIYLISGQVNKTAKRMEINSCLSIKEAAPLSPEARGLKTNPPVCA